MTDTELSRLRERALMAKNAPTLIERQLQAALLVLEVIKAVPALRAVKYEPNGDAP